MECMPQDKEETQYGLWTSMTNRVLQLNEVKNGKIRCNQLDDVLRKLNPYMSIDAQYLSNQIEKTDSLHSGSLDVESVVKIAISIILKKSISSETQPQDFNNNTTSNPEKVMENPYTCEDSQENCIDLFNIFGSH